jgi:acetolactate synthase-1/2/3 large subunit
MQRHRRVYNNRIDARPTDAITGGEAVYWALRDLGVDHVFGIVSIHNIPIFEAIDRLGGITHCRFRLLPSSFRFAPGLS